MKKFFPLMVLLLGILIISTGCTKDSSQSTEYTEYNEDDYIWLQAGYYNGVIQYATDETMFIFLDDHKSCPFILNDKTEEQNLNTLKSNDYVKIEVEALRECDDIAPYTLDCTSFEVLDQIEFTISDDDIEYLAQEGYYF